MLKRVEKIQEILKRFRDIQDAQMETTILRSCLALPKVCFTLPSCPPHLVKYATSAFDYSMMEALSNFVGTPLSRWSGLKTSLPAALGGLGYFRAFLHVPVAYISSLDQFRELVTRMLGQAYATTKLMAPDLLNVAKAARREDCSIEGVDVPLRQCRLSKAIDHAVFDELLAMAPNTWSKALALTSSINHAGDWLSVIPSSALGFHLHYCEFRFCLQYWLGLQMVEEGTRCPVCQAVADLFRDHQVGCGGNRDRIHQHDSLRDALYPTVQFAALAPSKKGSAVTHPWISQPPR